MHKLLLICVHFFLCVLREEEEDEELNKMMKTFSECLHHLHRPSDPPAALLISYLNPGVTAT